MYRSPEVKPDPRRALPAVDRLADVVAAERPDLPTWAILEGVRCALAEARERLSESTSGPDADDSRMSMDLAARSAVLAAALCGCHPRRVVNATGISLHTNLGRAPLAPDAVRAVERAAASYSNLELDLETGRRGDRLSAVCSKLALLTEAPAALAVNNNAVRATASRQVKTFEFPGGRCETCGVIRLLSYEPDLVGCRDEGVTRAALRVGDFPLTDGDCPKNLFLRSGSGRAGSRQHGDSGKHLY